MIQLFSLQQGLRCLRGALLVSLTHIQDKEGANQLPTGQSVGLFLRQASDHRSQEGSQGNSQGWGWGAGPSRGRCAHPFSALRQRPPVWSTLSRDRTPLKLGKIRKLGRIRRSQREVWSPQAKKKSCCSLSSICPWWYDGETARGVSVAKQTESQNGTSCSAVFLRNTTSSQRLHFPIISARPREVSIEGGFFVEKKI